MDLNRVAVDLARLAIWVHTFVPGLPLSFLDHNLVVGNSLVGIATVEEAKDRLREILDQPLYEFSSEALIGCSRDSLKRLARLSDANAQEIERAGRLLGLQKSRSRRLLRCLTCSQPPELIRILSKQY